MIPGAGQQGVMQVSQCVRIVALFAAPLLGSACPSDESEDNPIVCSGASCNCGADETCDISEQTCAESSCSLDCEAGSVCQGECGESCSVDCGAGATCDLTVGKSGSVTCTDDATCQITCTDECSVSCGDASECSLQCADDDEPKALTEGGGCE